MLRSLAKKFSTHAKTNPSTASDSIKASVIQAKDFKFSKNSVLGLNENQTPKMIQEYLENHVVGQEESKKALAIAYSNYTNKIWF